MFKIKLRGIKWHRILEAFGNSLSSIPQKSKLSYNARDTDPVNGWDSCPSQVWKT